MKFICIIAIVITMIEICSGLSISGTVSIKFKGEFYQEHNVPIRFDERTLFNLNNKFLGVVIKFQENLITAPAIATEVQGDEGYVLPYLFIKITDFSQDGNSQMGPDGKVGTYSLSLERTIEKTITSNLDLP
jgi:hypothetical protein